MRIFLAGAGRNNTPAKLPVAPVFAEYGLASLGPEPVLGASALNGDDFDLGATVVGRVTAVVDGGATVDLFSVRKSEPYCPSFLSLAPLALPPEPHEEARHSAARSTTSFRMDAIVPKPHGHQRSPVPYRRRISGRG